MRRCCFCHHEKGKLAWVERREKVCWGCKIWNWDQWAVENGKEEEVVKEEDDGAGIHERKEDD